MAMGESGRGLGEGGEGEVERRETEKEKRGKERRVEFKLCCSCFVCLRLLTSRDNLKCEWELEGGEALS